MEPIDPLLLCLFAVIFVGGWVVHLQFDEARQERRQIIKAIDFLEKEIARMRERLPLNDRDLELIKAISEQERPYRYPDFK